MQRFTRQLSILKQLLMASRPFSWVNTAAPFMAGYLLATGRLDIGFWIGLIYFLWPYNLAMYGVNDIYDYESDIKNPRKGSIEGSIVAPSERKVLWCAIGILNIPFLAYFLWQGSATSNVVILAVAFLCISYSIKGLRFKEIPFLDSLNSACHFVGPMLFGLAFGQSSQYYVPVLLAFLFWGIASQSFGAIQDIGPDREGGIKSIATFLGARRTANYALGFYLASAIIVTIYFWPTGLLAGALLTIYALNVMFFRKYKSDAQAYKYRRGWKNFLWLNWLVGFWLTQLILFFSDPFRLGSGRYQIIAFSLIALGLGQLVLAGYNQLTLHRPKLSPLHELPKVSVIIHALDQAANINSTLLSALGQSYPDFEILFTDLGSSDNTLKLVRGFQDDRLHVVDVTEPAPGWEAGAWAADQLTKQASGEIVVSVAADTILMPNALATIVGLMHHKQLQLVSLLPADQNKTLAQKLVLNQNHFLLLGCYPAGIVEKRHPSINLAYSGLIGFEKGAIARIDGFKKTRKSPIAEMELARQASLAGLKTGFYLASDLATSQNHATLDMILKDNITRFYPALQFNMPLTFSGASLGAFLFITPGVGLAIAGFTASSATPIWLAAYAAGLLPRLLVSTRSKQGFLGAILYPATGIITIGSMLLSMLNYELFKPRWQNRTELS